MRAKLILLAAICLLEGVVSAQQPMNVLFIAIDDLKRIGGYMSEEPGNYLQWIYPDPDKRAEAKSYLTPNLDKLASDGVAFTHAHCPTPACNPSRTALMTGFRPFDTSFTANGDGKFRDWPDPLGSAITLSQNLIAHGYYAAGLGKIYHTNNHADPEYSWVDWLNRSWGTIGPAIESPWSPRNTNPNTNVKFGIAKGKISEQNDYVNADFIATLMEKGSATIDEKTYYLPSDKPFFLACGIFRPHLPFYAPKELVDLFDANELDLTRQRLNDALADLNDLPPGGLGKCSANSDGTVTKGGFRMILQHGLGIDPVDGDLKAWREFVRHYLASAAFADRCVGRLLEGLANSPYADNTLVVLWSDHGWALGEKYRIKKFALWMEEAECVLIIKNPNQPQSAGSLCRHTVSTQDLYRTIHSICGIPVPIHVAGRDISYSLVEPNSPWDNAPLSTISDIDHTIATGEYRYIRYDNDSSDDELYDENADPDEIKNLVLDPAYDAVETRMENRLEAILAYEPKLQAHYLFEGNTNDSSGNGNNGTAHASVKFGAGAGGTRAIILDGTDDYVEIPRSIEDDFTLAFWIKTTQKAGTAGQWYDGIGLVDGNASGTMDDFGASLLGGKFTFGVGNPDTTISSVSDVNDGTWHQVAATRDGATGQIKLYVDGVEENSAVGPQGARNAVSVLHIGKLQSDSGYFNGSIDDLRLYNYILSAADIAYLVSTYPPASYDLSDALDTTLGLATGGPDVHRGEWFSQTVTSYYDGDAAQSGDISDDQKSWMQMTVSGPTTVEFYWKVSSEVSFDFLEFYIDDVLQDQINGSKDWEQKSYTISSGLHTLEWRYVKDSTVSSGSDCGWVDKVEVGIVH